MAQNDADATLAQLGGKADAPIEQNASYLAAQAQVDKARRDLTRTTVLAPIPGIVTNVDALQVGEYLPAAQPAFSLVSSADVWIEANPKESDLAYLKAGAPAVVTIDAYPGREWQATVTSLAPATGTEFSVLPAQNATGNWVKVVQRVPIRLDRADAGRRAAAAHRHERHRRDRHRPSPPSRRPVRRGEAVRGDVIIVGPSASLAGPLDDGGPGGRAVRKRMTMQTTTSKPKHLGAPDALHHARHDHAGAGHDHRQRGAALHAGLAVGDGRPDQLGADLLYRGRRHRDAGHRLPRGAAWPQAAVPDRRRGFHRGLGAVRHRHEPARDGGVPPDPGPVRRLAGAAEPSRAARFLPEGEARLGHGDVGHGRDGGPDPGPDARRLADRGLQLALGVLHQRADRHPDLRRPLGLSQRNQDQQDRLRLVRLRHALDRHRLVPDDARPRRAARLVLLDRDLDRGRAGGARLLSLPGADLHGRSSPSSIRRSSATATSPSASASSSWSASSCWPRWR